MLKIIFFLILSVCSFQIHAQGSVVGNGGDGIAIQFRNLARAISENLQSTTILSAADLKTFSQSVEKADIQTEDRLFLNGNEVDAINYPSLQKITISRTRWLLTSRTTASAFSLVFHEFLGLQNIHDDQLVKKYTDVYVDQFVNAAGNSRPELVVQCKASMAPSDVGRYVPDARPMGNKNLLIYRQNDDYLIHYQDNLLPMSMRPYDTIDHFLGYFKCHMNPDRTNISCSEAPCSSITLNLDKEKHVSIVSLKVDRVTENCTGPAAEQGDTILNYVKTDIVFPAGQCLSVESKKP